MGGGTKKGRRLKENSKEKGRAGQEPGELISKSPEAARKKRQCLSGPDTVSAGLIRVSRHDTDHLVRSKVLNAEAVDGFQYRIKYSTMIY